MSQYTWPPIQTTSGPLQYVKNGTTTTVSQDTGTPANSTPLPVTQLNTSGVAVDPATSTLQTANNVLVGAVTETAPATDTASSGLNGRLQRIAQRLTSLIALFPTSLGTKAAASSLAITWSTEDEALIGALTETAPATDTASSGLNGRLQRVAQRLTSLIGLLPTSLGQKTMAASLAVTIASDQTVIPVSQSSVISTNNSSTAALGIGAVFTGTSEAVQNYSMIQVSVFADQASAALGLSIQQSSNGTNWDYTDVYTVPISTGKVYSFAPAASFFRIVYTNGGVANTVFRLQTVFHYNYVKPSTHSLADAITLQNDAELIISQLRATNGTNTVSVTAQATGQLDTNNSMVNGVAISTGNGVTGTGVQRVTVSSDNTPFAVKVDQTTPGTTNAVSVSQLGATTISTGNGVAGPGVQRVAISSDNTPFIVKAGSKTPVNKSRNDYTSTSVTTAAYTQLIASTAAAISEVEIFDSSGQTLVLAIGAAASEVDQIYIFPGGNGRVPLSIATATRVSIKAVSATASVGESTINFYST